MAWAIKACQTRAAFEVILGEGGMPMLQTVSRTCAALIVVASVDTSLASVTLAKAAETRTVCLSEFTTDAGQAKVRSQTNIGGATTTTAEFFPMLQRTIEGVPPAILPDITKADGSTPNIGAFPAAMLSYEFLTQPDGSHTLPAYRLSLQVPAYSGGANRSVYFKVKVGAWEGGKIVERRNISAIMGLVDVPIFEVGFQIRPFDIRQADADGPALGSALPGVDHADVEIHDGGADGPLRLKGKISLAAHKERFTAVGGALKSVAEAARIGSCDTER